MVLQMTHVTKVVTIQVQLQQLRKLAKGLSKHPAVQNVLKRTNEDTQSGAKALMDRIIWSV